MSSFSTAFTTLAQTTPPHLGKLYLVTNEVRADETLKTAMEHPVENATVVVFTSGMFGLNYASARGLKSLSDKRIQHLISLDYSQTVKEFWELAAPIIRESINAADCAQKINNLVKTQSAKFFPTTQLNDSDSTADQWLKMLNLEISLGQSWLFTDERFQIIKGIFSNDHFVHLSVDLRSVDNISSISKTLQKLELKIDSIYLSNVAEFFKPDELTNYQQALQQFQTNSIPTTFFIDTYPQKKGLRLRSSKHAHQRVQQSFHTDTIEKLLAATQPQKNPEPVIQGAQTSDIKE